MTLTGNPFLVVSVVAGIAYGAVLQFRPGGLFRTSVKTAAVGALALWAWMAGAPPLLTGALALSAVGDAFLAGNPDRWLPPGLGSRLEPGWVVREVRRSLAATARSACLPLDVRVCNCYKCVHKFAGSSRVRQSLDERRQSLASPAQGMHKFAGSSMAVIEPCASIARQSRTRGMLLMSESLCGSYGRRAVWVRCWRR